MKKIYKEAAHKNSGLPLDIGPMTSVEAVINQALKSTRLSPAQDRIEHAQHCVFALQRAVERSERPA